MQREKKQQENTIIDLAKALKLSPATISRALNNGQYVKTETKKRVMEMAEKIGYRRNLMASGLRSKKTNTIGLIVPQISMFFHAQVITSIQNKLYEHGYNLIICQSNDSLKMEKDLAGMMLSSRVDALIVACTLQTKDFSHFDQLINKNIPVIFYDRVPTKPYHAIQIKGDDFRGGYLATQHLLELGCKRIAHITGSLSSNLYIERLRGYKHALNQYNIKVDDSLIYFHELSHENARKSMEKMLGEDNFPDAVFTANDTSAIAVLEFAREHDISVPDNLKIVGYSNDQRTAIISPSITTIEQFPTLVGNRVVEELIEILTNKNNTDSKTHLHPIITMPIELVRRMST